MICKDTSIPSPHSEINVFMPRPMYTPWKFLQNLLCYCFGTPKIRLQDLVELQSRYNSCFDVFVCETVCQDLVSSSGKLGSGLPYQIMQSPVRFLRRDD
mmetsp:Transcript_13256/g.46363  ORF Transcript_13256/g.46363 Transcript_13256/m.46363 type:complete len:99 (+) Transcript_13256:429-725(+)